MHNQQKPMLTVFQSTPPRRRRLIVPTNVSSEIFDFNPRLREGGDVNNSSLRVSFKISIHASAKEATNLKYRKCLCILFQSTPPRRRRHCRFCNNFDSHNFNPRLREGGD